MGGQEWTFIPPSGACTTTPRATRACTAGWAPVAAAGAQSMHLPRCGRSRAVSTTASQSAKPSQSANAAFFEIHNRILFKIKALRLTHNTHTTPLKRSEPARKHTHPPPHHTYQRTPHTKQSHLQQRKERAPPIQRFFEKKRIPMTSCEIIQIFLTY